MTGHNERKIQVLEYLREIGEGTTNDLAGAFNLEIHNARNALRRYHRQGLLSRYQGDQYGTRVYAITAKGVARIAWIRNAFDGVEDEWDEDDNKGGDVFAGIDEETRDRVTHLLRGFRELGQLVPRQDAPEPSFEDVLAELEQLREEAEAEAEEARRKTKELEKELKKLRGY